MIADAENTGDRERPKLPRRRPHVVIAAIVGATRVHLGIGLRPDGGLREIFIDLHKEGAPVRGLFHLIAQLTSIGLRAGVPMAAIVRAFRTVEDGEQQVVDHESITVARSIPDFVGQALAAEFQLGVATQAPTSAVRRSVVDRPRVTAHVISEMVELTDGALEQLATFIETLPRRPLTADALRADQVEREARAA